MNGGTRYHVINKSCTSAHYARAPYISARHSDNMAFRKYPLETLPLYKHTCVGRVARGIGKGEIGTRALYQGSMPRFLIKSINTRWMEESIYRLYICSVPSSARFVSCLSCDTTPFSRICFLRTLRNLSAMRNWKSMAPLEHNHSESHTHITQFISFVMVIGANLCSPQLVAQSIKYYDVICMWNSLISLRFSVFFSFFSSSVYLLKLAWVLCRKCELWLSFQIDAIT